MSTTVSIQAPPDCLYSIEKAASLLSISPWTVRKWLSQRRIASCKLGTRRLIPSSEVTRIISAGMEGRDEGECEQMG